ncbi:MAG TPA: TonB-dependent receptor, partial [Terriglobales bacterium]|nr:TonB-dependent receptor [Terriglobales bacterium]
MGKAADDQARAAHRRCLAMVGALLLLAGAAAAEDVELTDLSLEELFNVEVTSASKIPERRSEAAAALSVIGHQELRRLGVTTLPDALRVVPGVHVARIDAGKWAVSVRGFSNRFSNKLLVMMDGRSIYTPLFAGVFWDVQDTFLTDIDRIEVIRGPGAALWGANAVNGVINIMTRSAAETQGVHAHIGGGNEEQVVTGVRYGGKLGERIHYRVYGKYADRDGGSEPPNGLYGFDEWWKAQGGFRTDWDLSDRDSFTFQGDAYGGETSPWGLSPDSADVLGANLLGRWRHHFRNGSDTTLQIFYDTTMRDDPFFLDRRHTFDIDFQHRLQLLDWNELLWGFGYRLNGDVFEGTAGVRLTEESRQLNTVAAFVQDTVFFFDEAVRLSLGVRLEHNDFSGFEYQPSGRVAWTILPDLTAWGSVARAVRVPSRLENDLVLGASGPSQLRGSPATDAEELISYQTGVRWQPTTRAFFDIAGFYHEYDDLISFDVGS